MMREHSENHAKRYITAKAAAKSITIQIDSIYISTDAQMDTKVSRNKTTSSQFCVYIFLK